MRKIEFTFIWKNTRDCAQKVERSKLIVSVINSTYLLFSIACNWIRVGYFLFTGMSLSKVDFNRLFLGELTDHTKKKIT